MWLFMTGPSLLTYYLQSKLWTKKLHDYQFSTNLFIENSSDTFRKKECTDEIYSVNFINTQKEKLKIYTQYPSSQQQKVNGNFSHCSSTILPTTQLTYPVFCTPSIISLMSRVEFIQYCVHSWCENSKKLIILYTFHSTRIREKVIQ